VADIIFLSFCRKGIKDQGTSAVSASQVIMSNKPFSVLYRMGLGTILIGSGTPSTVLVYYKVEQGVCSIWICNGSRLLVQI